jgi:hypothetical protein
MISPKYRSRLTHGFQDFPAPLDSTQREIIAAGIKALAKKNHPDVGGSIEAMQKINEAAERLLG